LGKQAGVLAVPPLPQPPAARLAAASRAAPPTAGRETKRLIRLISSVAARSLPKMIA
jgi:hypothetical protein